MVDQPRLLEVVRTDGVASLADVLEAVAAGARARPRPTRPAAAGATPGSGRSSTSPPPTSRAAAVASCAVVDRPAGPGRDVTAALEARGVRCHTVALGDVAAGFAGAADALASAAERLGPLDAVVVALAGRPPATDAAAEWERVLAEHAGIVDGAPRRRRLGPGRRRPRRRGRPTVRLVTLTDATTAGGRSRAQAAAQLARSARRPRGDRVAAFAVSVEAAGRAPIGELVGPPGVQPGAPPACPAPSSWPARGWFGLRSHPRPAGSISFGGPAMPDVVRRRAARASSRPR